MSRSRIEDSRENVKQGDEKREVTENEDVDAAPAAEDGRRLVVGGVRYFVRDAHSVFPALNKFAKMRNAPGTPAGSSRNHESDVNT